jgi:hypothetical protein
MMPDVGLLEMQVGQEGRGEGEGGSKCLRHGRRRGARGVGIYLTKDSE